MSNRPGFLVTLIGVAVLLGAFSMFAPQSKAWWSGGHKMCTVAAVRMLPDSFPAFFKEAEEELSEMCLEPDEWKSPMTPRLKISEGPEHFIDIEHFDNGNFPRHRYEALKHYATENKDMAKGGNLPYALEEGYERLLLAFRKVRIYPESKSAKSRALMYAGWLAHYCQDAGMPLHTTVNYDGKPSPDGGKPIQKGIHARLDGYPEKNGFTPEMLMLDQKADRVAAAWNRIESFIKESHTHVEKCYELDAAGGFSDSPDKAREFVLGRARLSAKLTADLWLTAWEKSDPTKATIK